MARLPIDLKDYKKSESDKHTTTLTHKAGHQIKLVHSALEPSMREKLTALPMSKDKEPKKMADGGKVKSNAEQMSQGFNESEGQYKSRKDQGLTKPSPTPDKYGNKIQSLAEGGEVKENYDAKVMVPMSHDEAKAHYDAQKKAIEPKKMADGGEVEAAADAAKKLSQSDPGAPITINIGGGPQPLPDNLINPNAGKQAMEQSQILNPHPVQDNSPKLSDVYGVSKEMQAQMMQPQAQAQAPIASPAIAPEAAPQAQPQADPYGLELQQNALAQGIAEQKAGIMGEAQAQGQQGAAEVKALRDNAAQQQVQQKSYTDHVAELDQERHHFQQDLIDAHIDPNRFMNSKGIAGKISTAIGLIIGGLGGSDAPIKFLNQQIDRDIDSQKSELGKRENLLSANMKQFGNLRDATDMTRVMQNDILVGKLKTAAANAATPMAQAAALKAIGQIDAQTAPLLSQIALRKTLMSSMGDAQKDPAQMGQVIQAMRQLNPEMAKSMEERFIPGVGMAQVPIPQATRDTVIAKQNLGKALTDMYSWASKNSGNVDPSTVNEGKAKAAELQSMYRNAINGGVFKAGEQEFIDQIIDSDPTKFFNSVRVLPKLKEVMSNNTSQLNTIKRGYGLPVSQIQESAPILPKK